MERAIEKLRKDIEEFLGQLQTKRTQFHESLYRDEILADTKKILSEIRHLETKIVEVVEEYFKSREPDYTKN